MAIEQGHLCLTRGLNEEIVIGQGDDIIVVRIEKIQNSRVKLGIYCNRDKPVHRREVFELLKAQGELQ